ncbi:MAG TPA: NAD(P)H-hydrate dehydratase, partial [bacterium]|nr:NAD(P)H-hydrate dehydratase [bacterium]
MEVLSASQSREADRLAIETRGIPSSVLMENAAKGVVESLRRNVPDLAKKKVAVVVGKGNNGGDGRIAARLLEGAVREARIVEVSNVGAYGHTPLRDADIVVDALFGTGLSRPVEGEVKAAIEAINRSGAWVLSIDIPSGLSADTGEALGAAVKADVTVTMGRPKTGLLQSQAAPYVGRLEVADIGIPSDIYEGMKGSESWVTAADVAPWFHKREGDSHKGTYGHVLLIGGSEDKPGAILLSGRAALRTGTGLATVALPDKAFRKFPKNFLELMFVPLPSHRSGTLAKTAWTKLLKAAEGKKAVAIGPGLGVNADTKALVKNAVLKLDAPLVLDADALNALSVADLKKRKHPAILTPHPGEMSRLTGLSTAKIQKDRLGVARDFAVANRVVLVLKGFRTVTATPMGKVFVNSTGNPGMATAGMGDVLTGVITSLIAQGLEPERAAVAGVYLHGRAGDRVAERL